MLYVSGSAAGAEASVLDRQLQRFMQAHPGIRVERQETPDAADLRHQLYVQWLNARVGRPDILQLDVIWTSEFAAAGWILPLDSFTPDTSDFFAPTLEASRHEARLYALPWFVDAGMLYYRSDLFAEPPRTFDELRRMASAARTEYGLDYGLVWQGARYEGLVTVFLEHLGGFGGALADSHGNVSLDSPAARSALSFMVDAIHRDRFVPEAVVTWQEEQTRFAFQSGKAGFMRNWPYAYALMQDSRRSAVAGRFSVAPMPAAPGGEPTAALGGQELAINAESAHPVEAFELLTFLTAPEQMLERARLAGHLPPRPSLYEGTALESALAMPAQEALRVIEHARPRPTTPVYTDLSETLQVELHRALTRQATPDQALSRAHRQMSETMDASRRSSAAPSSPRTWLAGFLALALLCALAAWAWRARIRQAPNGDEAIDKRLAWLLLGPAIVITASVAVLPLGWTVLQSFYAYDLRRPFEGRVFIGLDNYAEAFQAARFWGALGRTLFFTGVSVALELSVGLALALLLHRAFFGRGVARTAALLPWAIPTVVAALIWRFLFESETGLVNALLRGAGIVEAPIGWLAGATSAWVPVVLGDVWKTSPFVALILLAGLESIDREVSEAARTDGAGPFAELVHVTLPLLRPAIVVALVFRALDAFRVFDLVYVLTGGGPGVATEPVALYAFDAMLRELRFGYGSALSVLIFVVSFGLALIAVRLLGTGALERAR